MSDRGQFLGPFELRGQLGRGAMAVVWRAYDPSLDREVAIKEPVLPPESSPEIRAEFAERFVREARAAARLNYPGIVTIYSASLFEGRPQIVMELVDGRTLREVLDDGALTTRQTYALLDQLLAAAGYAHEHGVTHRDLKPDNVFVTRDGVVKLADFGIAQLGQAGPALTRAGTMLGTPAYMAPEQIRGEPVDVRCDVFALGVIAYECLSGANPFGSESSTHYATIIHRIMSEPVPPLTASDELGSPLAGVVMRALEKDRSLRFENANVMLLAWRGALSAIIDTRAELVESAGAAAVGTAGAAKATKRPHKTQIWGQPLVEEEPDTEPPETTLSGADDAWHAEDVALTLTASDAGSGVAATEYRVDGGPWTEGSAFTVSGDGEHQVEYRSTDQAGNREAARSARVRIDARPPETTLSGADDAWHAEDVALTLTASDAGSGVAATEYRVDGGPWTEGSAFTVSGDGEHQVEYRSIDQAGNREAARSARVRIERARRPSDALRRRRRLARRGRRPHLDRVRRRQRRGRDRVPRRRRPLDRGRRLHRLRRRRAPGRVPLGRPGRQPRGRQERPGADRRDARPRPRSPAPTTPGTPRTSPSP